MGDKKPNAPAFDVYVRRGAEVVTDPENARYVYVVETDPLSYCDCPVGWYDADTLAVVPIDASRGFTDAIWVIPDDLDYSGIVENTGYVQEALEKHFSRAGWPSYTAGYNGGNEWADFVVAVAPGCGAPESYAEEICDWLAGDVYTVTAWGYDGEEWTEGDTVGGVYLSHDDRDGDICSVGRDLVPDLGDGYDTQDGTDFGPAPANAA